MTRRTDGAWHGCCGRLGYWSELRPLPRDSWYPVTTSGRLTFYPTANWPAGLKPVAPRGE